MFAKPSPLTSLTRRRSTIVAATPIFFLVLLALWTFMNTSAASTDRKQLPDDVFEFVKQAAAQPDAEDVDMTPNGTTLSLVQKYDNRAQHKTAALDSDKHCFSVSEGIPPTLPEQSQWN